MWLSDQNQLLSFFGNNRRATMVAQANIAKFYSYVYAWKGDLGRPDDQVITLEKIFDECSRASGVDVAYGFVNDPAANDCRLYMIRNGVVKFVNLDVAKEIAEITSPIEEIPY